MEGTGPVVEKGMRGAVARAFSLTEDVVYAGMGVLLAFSDAGSSSSPPSLDAAQAARFRDGMLEIGLLTVMVVALVASLLMLRSRGRSQNEMAAAS